MPFHVEWHADALEELAAIWLRAHDPEMVTMASAQVDHDLSTDPHAVGRPSGPLLRSNAVIPLDVLDEIVDSQQRVFVVSVTEWRPDFN